MALILQHLLGYGKSASIFKSCLLWGTPGPDKGDARVRAFSLSRTGVCPHDLVREPQKGRDDSDGQSVETAFKNVRHGIGAASRGDTILLVPAPYDEDLLALVSQAKGAGITLGVLGER